MRKMPRSRSTQIPKYWNIKALDKIGSTVIGSKAAHHNLSREWLYRCLRILVRYAGVRISAKGNVEGMS